MAGVSECFGIGSIVSCKTCNDQEYEGEVLAFDPQTKMLIIKSPASNGKAKLNDIHVINLDLVSGVSMIKEESSSHEPLQNLNLQRINTRAKNQVDEKRRLVSALRAGVSVEGRNLYLAITRTIEDVKWNGPDIIILNEVAISPPYRMENIHLIRGGPDTRALLHVKKLVEKHLKDQQLAATGATSSNATGNATSSPPSSQSPLPIAANKQ